MNTYCALAICRLKQPHKYIKLEIKPSGLGPRIYFDPMLSRKAFATNSLK